MTKKLDIDKINSALKRAAQAAISGPREDRSGRFIPRNNVSGRLITSKPDKGASGGIRKK